MNPHRLFIPPAPHHLGYINERTPVTPTCVGVSTPERLSISSGRPGVDARVHRYDSECRNRAGTRHSHERHIERLQHPRNA